LARASSKAVVERCWVLVGSRQGPFWHARRTRPTRGEIACVHFEAARVLSREESKGDVVGFYHTHPAGPPEPSQRDVRTMRAWVSSFGKPLLCLIESEGELAAYSFDSDESPGVRLAACELCRGGRVLAFDSRNER
jgi:proteasome lid subunit RPN8/RPN11